MITSPTGALRWVQKEVEVLKPHTNKQSQMILQQEWIDEETGKKFWQNVPVIFWQNVPVIVVEEEKEKEKE